MEFLFKMILFLLFWPVILAWWFIKFAFKLTIVCLELFFIGLILNGLFGCHCVCHHVL